jgi:hypothetical protein
MSWESEWASGAAGAAQPVFDPAMSPTARATLLVRRETLWAAGESAPVSGPMQAGGADNHAKAIGLLAVPATGLTIVGLLLRAEAEQSGGFVAFLYRVAEGLIFLVTGVIVFVALGLWAAMVRSRSRVEPHSPATTVAADFQGRYVLPSIDLDDEHRAIYLRAREACAKILTSRAYVLGLLDTKALRAVLPRLMWELANELAELTNQFALLADQAAEAEYIAQYGEYARPRPAPALVPGPIPETGAEFAQRDWQLARATATAQHQVAALEAHADRVAALDPLCEELAEARAGAADDPTVEMTGVRTLAAFAEEEKSWLTDALSASRARVDSEARNVAQDVLRLRDLLPSSEPRHLPFTPPDTGSAMMGS